MQYKTITLELLKERPELYEHLRQTHRLLPMLETWSGELKAGHEVWIETLAQAKPESESSQIASEALEAVLPKELEDRLALGSFSDDWEAARTRQWLSARRHTSNG